MSVPRIKDKATSLIAQVKGKGAVDILVGNTIAKIAGFFGSLVLVRLLSKADYGVLGYMENIYWYVFLFAGYGLNNALFRYMVLKKTLEEKKGIFDYVVQQGTLFNLCLVIVAGIVATFFPFPAEFAVASTLLPVMFIGVLFQYLCDSCSFSLRALFLNRPFAIFAIFTALIIWGSKLIGSSCAGLFGVVLSWPIGFILIFVAFAVFLKTSVFKNTKGVKVDKKERPEIRKYSIQYMLTNGLWTLFMQNDILLLGILLADPIAIAEYKVAYIFPAAIAIVGNSIGMFASPYFIRHETDKAWVWSSFKKLLGATSLILGAVCVALAVFSEPLINLVYGSSYSNVASLMCILLIAAFINNAIRYTAANLFAAMGKIKINLIIAGVGTVLQLVVNFLLIPILGVYGAALTAIIVYAVMATAVIIAFVVIYRPKGVESNQ